MKFLIIGLGSMGKRRIRCLKELGETDLIGYDLKENSVDIPTFARLEDALEQRPDAFLICTPPDQHRQYQKKAVELGIPFFVEHSVLNEGLMEYDMGIPSATMMFCASVESLKHRHDNCKDIDKFRYFCRSWLPDWHPNNTDENYYAFKPEVNACKEMVPFELCWLKWVFGEIETIESITQKSGLFGDFIDLYVLKVRFNSGVEGIVEIDVTTKSARGGERRISLVGRNGTYDQIIHTNEEMYVKEVNAFVNHVIGKKRFPHTLKQDYDSIKWLERIENDNGDNLSS